MGDVREPDHRVADRAEGGAVPGVLFGGKKGFAAKLSYDEEALLIEDPEHSQEEDRFILLGFSLKANLLAQSVRYRLISV